MKRPFLRVLPEGWAVWCAYDERTGLISRLTSYFMINKVFMDTYFDLFRGA